MDDREYIFKFVTSSVNDQGKYETNTWPNGIEVMGMVTDGAYCSKYIINDLVNFEPWCLFTAALGMDSKSVCYKVDKNTLNTMIVIAASAHMSLSISGRMDSARWIYSLLNKLRVMYAKIDFDNTILFMEHGYDYFDVDPIWTLE